VPVLESLTIAAGIGAFGFLVYYLRRRVAARSNGEALSEEVATDVESGGRSRPAGMPSAATRGPDSPLAVLMEQDLFVNLADAIDGAVLIHDESVYYGNRAAAELFGIDAADIRGTHIDQFVHPEFRDAVNNYIRNRLQGTENDQPFAIQILDAEDQPRWVEVNAFEIPGGGSNLLGSIVRESRSHALERAVERGRGMAWHTLDSIGEGIVTTDLDGHIDYLNGAAEMMAGCSRDAAIGKQLGDLVSLVDEADRKELGDPVNRCLMEGCRIDLGRRTLLVSKSEGEEISIELTASPIRDAAREIVGAVVLLHDVSEIRGLTRQMSYQASHDPLTGLANRREFERRLEDAVAGAHGGSAGHVLCYLDLDRFKVVNDSCGHMAGDNLLREVATLIRDQVRDSDSVARVGGDEFGMLLKGCPLDKARQIADDVCAALRDYRFVWRDRIFNVGVSIGLVEISHETGTLEDLMGAADSACYVAKQKGRGRVHVYSARDEALARQRGEIVWLQRIQRALKEDRFELYVQPIVSVAGRVETGPACEVLLRMRDDDNQIISPTDFMQAAERYHLMPNVDRWVLQAAFAAIASGAIKLPDSRSCTINLSGQTLGDPQFLDFVVDSLDRSGIPPHKVCFEVRESSVIANLSNAARFIAVLHGMGCQFALDEFGSGLGSFANLKSLSMDFLKIDGAIVRNLDSDDVSEAMVVAMITLAATMGIRVVAVYVENQAIFERVRDMGVDFAQGFAVGRPEPISLSK
jgi:diguanylate cyclase (GGDEF)-like protein/PAS domain S-box-containing protein